MYDHIAVHTRPPLKYGTDSTPSSNHHYNYRHGYKAWMNESNTSNKYTRKLLQHYTSQHAICEIRDPRKNRTRFTKAIRCYWKPQIFRPPTPRRNSHQSIMAHLKSYGPHPPIASYSYCHR